MTSPRRPESSLGMTPREGQHVITRDTHELGTVKETTTDAFKVDAPMKRDYWLSIGSVLSIQGEQIVMDFDEETLEAYQLDSPDAPVTSESPIIDAQMDTFSSPEEKELRRQQQMYPESGEDV